MLTFIAFLLTIAGSINWLLIGMLQYDFIAGLFGYQASIFSRIFYILFGIGAVYLVIRIIVNKGSVKIFEKRKKKKQEEKNEPNSQTSPARANIDAAQEQLSRHNYPDEQFDLSTERYKNDDSLFDEHIKRDL